MNPALANLKGGLKAAPAWQQWVTLALLLVGATTIGILAWWLLLPAANSTIGVSARTGSLTVETLCGERLIWDLPPGRVGRRSALPGAGIVDHSGRVTFVLNAGARAVLTSPGGNAIAISVAPAEEVVKLCGVESAASFDVIVSDETLEHDPEGFNYVAEAQAPSDKTQALSLPLSGRVILGQAVQQGAGWDSLSSGMLLSGTLALRVVPAFSDERVTLGTEQIEEGSLVDTHGCLGDAGHRATSCLSVASAPARGFVRTLASGGFAAQLYAHGPVGVLAYGGIEQHLIAVPNSTAAWRSDVLKVIGGALLMLLAFLKYFVEFRGFIVGKMVEWGEPDGSVEARQAEDHSGDGHASSPIPTELEELQESTSTGEMATTPIEAKGGPGVPDRRKLAALSCCALPTLAILMTSFVAPPASAEPVEIRQDAYTGAGFSFRRGSACLVVTARHVVAEIGVPILVLDRTGAKAEAARTYDNESYDLALVALRDSPPAIACTTAWPQTAWMRGAAFTSASDFQALRHYPGGKEVIVRLKYAGGTKDRLSLAPAEKLTIRESDSGSIVMLDGKPVGIVQSIDTATDRVSVLRFDVVDQLIGDRFRSATSLAPLQVDGVFQRGRQNTNWSAFLRAWVTESTGRQAIAQKDGAARCKFAVDVLEWKGIQIPNPEYAKATQQDCSLVKLLGKQLLARCEEQRRSAIHSTPRTLAGYSMALEVKLTPQEGVPVTKLASGTATAEGGKRVRTTDSEFNAMETIMAPTAKELLDSGACD